MTITDEDTGTFADFTLRIDGPLAELFDIQPKFATGHVRPVIRVKKAFDYENPNERKFLLLVNCYFDGGALNFFLKGCKNTEYL